MDFYFHHLYVIYLERDCTSSKAVLVLFTIIRAWSATFHKRVLSQLCKVRLMINVNFNSRTSGTQRAHDPPIPTMIYGLGAP
jgi:hypothetical protein